jgi:uncharacterized membrane protein
LKTVTVDPRTPMRRARHRLAVLIGAPLAVAALAWSPGSSSAQAGLSITTPFPSVIVQPGADVQFELTISAQEPVRVDVTLEGLPDGWSASLSGGGNEVQGAFVDADSPATLTLTLDVAPDAASEPVTVTVVGTAGEETARLALDLIPAAGAGGTVNLQTDAPSIRGTSDEPFNFSVTLNNDTPQELAFSLSAAGPRGWEVTAEPSGEAQVATLTVAARSSGTIDVIATAPPQAAAGIYPIAVEAVAGEYRASAELAVEVIGSVALRLTTPDERLSTTANAGAAGEFTVRLVNDGTSPIEAVGLAGSGPSGWEITFEPATVDAVGAGESVDAIATITPSGNAVAGDYVVTLTASNESVSESIDVRVTVETAPVWGAVGMALILAVIAGLVFVFRRYGRR